MRIADTGDGPEIFCCEWVPYPQPGNDTSCSGCGSVFSVRDTESDWESALIPEPNFYAADGPAYADKAAAFFLQSALWSPDADAYAAGEIPASAVTCVLCQHSLCDCPEFRSPEYFALLDTRHGRQV